MSVQNGELQQEIGERRHEQTDAVDGGWQRRQRVFAQPMCRHIARPVAWQAAGALANGLDIG